MIAIAELRAWVGSDGSDDALLEQLEGYAVAQVELTTGAYLGESAPVSDIVIGDGTTALRLPKSPVTAVSAIVESWVTDLVPTPTAITDYVLRSPVLIRTGGAVWQWGAEYAVDYTAGYAEGSYPPLYYQAVLDIVAALYGAQTTAAAAAAGDVKAETLGEYSYTLTDASAGATEPSAARSAVASILAQLPRRIRV